MSELEITRRSFVAGTLASLAWPAIARAEASAARGHHFVGADGKPTEALRKVLGESRYVYVSPLLADGSESTCHGEIWYAWLDGAVISSTSTGSWKARALAKGRDRARLWVGDYGPWKKYGGGGGTNVAFRHGASFVATGHTERDPALLERILTTYGKKYPKEIGRWAGRMRRELGSGERVLLRYRPVAP